MKLSKKLLSLVMCLVMLASTFALSAISASADTSGTCGKGVKWKINSSGTTLTIYGKGNMKNFTGDNFMPWIDHYSSLKKVVVKDGVKTVGKYSFMCLYYVKSVKLGNTVKTIQSAAFAECEKLTSITLPKSVTSVKTMAFYECKKLNKVTILNTKKAPKIGKEAFEYTKSGIKFYVKNKTVAKQLKKNLKNSGVKKAKIYVGKKLIYKNVK